MEEKLFSLKLLFHKLKLLPTLFKNKATEFKNPKLAIKFLNFEVFTCESTKF